ncbi:MAG: cytochrome c [Moraxella sp.]|nr:cytochrome c [Moraxella sp.]
MTPKKFIAIFAIASLTLVGCNQNNPTSSGSDAVKTRQNLMKDWRGANDIMKGMLENPASFDAAAFKEQAEFISSTNAQMWTHFADAATKGDSQDAVWADAAGFKTKQDEFGDALANLVSVANNAKSADDVKQAFGAMAENCGSCHKVYKK